MATLSAFVARNITMSRDPDKSDVDAPAARDSEETLDPVYDIVRINKSIGANRFQDALRVRENHYLGVISVLN